MNEEKPQSNNLRIGWHVDTVEEALNWKEGKLVCCPGVEVGKAVMYFNGKKVARCCGIWCDWIGNDPTNILHGIVESDDVTTRGADCQECSIYGQGCFYGSYG